MRKIINLILFALLLGGVFLLKQEVFAAIRCETQYGGGQVCVTTGNLQINKTVFDPDSNSFKDNLANPNDHKFANGDEVKFNLAIKNVGDAAFGNVHVVDTLPNFLQVSSGDLAFDISNLTPGQTVERQIVAKVSASDSVVCDVNTAEANADSGEHDKDTSKVCVGKSVLGATPVTGPETGILILSLSLLAGIAGIYLLKFNKASVR
ncbi:MAG: hypothetical protein Q7S03_00220 [bacterium]|nr:hypothetical protein [bacterium]